MENQSKENNNSKENYYGVKSNRTKDLGRGVFVGLAYAVFSFMLLVNFRFVSQFSIALVVLYIGLILYFFFKKRRYLSIGLISVIVVPLAIVGGCLALISR